MDVDGVGEGTPVVPRVQASHNSYCVASETSLLKCSILVTGLKDVVSCKFSCKLSRWINEGEEGENPFG